MNFSQLKKLDEESLAHLQEGSGPVDECLCPLLSPPDAERKSLGASIKKAFANFNPGKKRKSFGGSRNVDIPIVFSKGEQGVYSTKEVVKRKSNCGRCGCDRENIVLKHSYANIRITSPDVSSICPCPNDCLPDKHKLLNNIKVTVERVTIDPDSESSETSLHNHRPRNVREPEMTDKRSVSSLINAQYEKDEENVYNR
ncbi:uncharacterized protein LOC124643900 [Helicoverpa zea]|uniref:uncharacterized protein LOC124643900 n=1 Tax=Helicoverpa zea TaxID=7113 RepID=UPI001F5878AA|nr:uncharacterized protein LOC124643900 [Helicoverpa zea]